MGKIAYLSAQELDEKSLLAYNLGSQRLIKMEKDGKSRLHIDRKCLDCNEVSTVTVSSVRDSKRRGAKLTGLCNSCSAKIIVNCYNPKRGKEHHRWKGGKSRRLNESGYVTVKFTSSDGSCVYNILEHRLVMEQHLDRKLSSNEIVHHKNGIRDDNRLENLELWTKHHPSGQRYSDLETGDLIKLLEEIKRTLLERGKIML